MTFSEGGGPAAAEAVVAPPEVPSGEPVGEGKAPERVIAPLKWSTRAAVEAPVDDSDDRSPVERMVDGKSAVSERFQPKLDASVEENPAETPLEQVQEVEFNGIKFKSSVERDAWVKSQLTRVSLADKKANELAKRAQILEDRFNRQSAVLEQYERFVKQSGMVDERGEATQNMQGRANPGKVDPGVAAEGLPQSLIDAVDWESVQRLSSDPNMGPTYAIAAALRSAEGVWEQREQRLMQMMEEKLRPDLGFVTDMRQTYEAAAQTGDFLKSQAQVLFRDGSPRFPELTGDPKKVESFVKEVLPLMDRLGPNGHTPAGFEMAVLALRGRSGAGVPASIERQAPVPPTQRVQAGVLGGDFQGSVGPAAQRTNPSSEFSQRIRAANTRSASGWQFAR